MDDTSLADLKKKLQSYQFRTKILHFELVSHRLNSRLHFILNGKGEFHLNDCNPTSSCRCRKVLDSPEDFFEDRINSPPNYIHSSKLHFKETPNEKKFYKPLFQLDKDELDKDFYQFRVLDSENICTWYEAYQKKTNVLQFQVKVRDLKIESEIDIVYNLESKEWHLTDCIRSAYCDLGFDTCHCQKAIRDPMKYLKDKYNYIELKKKKTTHQKT